MTIQYLRLLFTLSLFFLAGVAIGLAQSYEVFPREEYYQSEQKQQPFSSEQWLEVIEGIDYSETVRAERQEDENFFTDGSERDRQRRQYEEAQNNSSAFWATFFKFFIIALGILVVAIIIARFLGPEGLGKPRSKRIDQQKLEIELRNIEEHIHESDLDQFIEQALASQNYNLAIRLYYLALIKELSTRQLIRWKKDKTNRDYLRELSGQEFLTDFRQLTNVFERVWYGNRLLEQKDFEKLQPRFRQMIEAIQKVTVDLA